MKALNTYSGNGKSGKSGRWSVGRGGYDLAFEVYYNREPVVQGMLAYEGTEVSAVSSEYGNGYSSKEVAKFIADEWDECYLADSPSYEEEYDESLTEDTVKQNGKWVNKGKEGTHGKFKTKKAADAQRKAMFANGYKGESLEESLGLSKQDKDELVKVIEDAKKSTKSYFDKGLSNNLYVTFGTVGMTLSKIVGRKEKIKFVNYWKDKSVEDIIKELSNQDWKIEESLKESAFDSDEYEREHILRLAKAVKEASKGADERKLLNLKKTAKKYLTNHKGTKHEKEYAVLQKVYDSLLDEDWEPDEWEETDFLDDEGKKVYINIIEEAEDIDDLKDIAHDLYWHDKGLFAMLRHFPKDKSFEWIQNRMIEVIKSTMNESLTEASYGGAYDIEDDMFWTKDDLIEFSDAVCEKLTDKFGYQYDIADVGAENNNDMYITIMDTTHDIEADVSFRIKMSRIRAPRDLMKYLDTVVSQFVKKFEEEYQYYDFDESLSEDIDDFDPKYDARYEVNAYYGSPRRGNYAGLEDDFYTDDFEEVKDWVWEKCQKGLYINVVDRENGNQVNINTENYDFESDDAYRVFDDLKVIQECLNEADFSGAKDESLKKSVEDDYIKQADADVKKDVVRFTSLVNKGEAWDEALNKMGYICADPGCTSWIKEVSDGDIMFSIESDGDEGTIETSTIHCSMFDTEGNVVYEKSFNVFSDEWIKEDYDEEKSVEFASHWIWVKDKNDKWKLYDAVSSKEDVNDSVRQAKEDERFTAVKVTENGKRPDGHMNVFTSEGLDEDMSKPDFVVGFYAGPVDDYTLELINPKKIAQVDVSAEELRTKYGKSVDKLLNDYTSQTVDKLKSTNSWLKALILNFAEEKARKTGKLDDKFRNEERKFLETGIYMEKRLEEINYPFEDGIKKLSKHLGKMLLPKRENLKEGYAEISDDFSFARSNWDKLNTGVSFDDALEEYNNQYGEEHFYAKPLYVKSAWDTMVSMFKDKEFWESLKEDVDGDIDLDIETDFGDGSVEEGDTFIEDGREWSWIERIAGPIHLDFDNWSVWSARDWDYIEEKVKPLLINKEEFNVEVLTKIYDEAEVAYFVVDEDTGFIDWGPVETSTEAQDFLNGKVEDYENDEEYEEIEIEEESLTESRAIKNDGDYEVTLHYDDIGNGKEYDYTLGYDEVVSYLKEVAWANGDGPEDLNEDEYLEWVMDNFDELSDKYELNVLNYFESEASQYEYGHRYDEP